MGAYLDTPVREKVSEDKCDGNLSYGASSMQGWRISQEDAHTSSLDFDPSSKTSMFAVYDGHGGAEVAEYTALHLPDFLKSLEMYKNGKLGQALEDAFLGFDGTLVNDDVVAVLKELAQTEPDEDENEEEQAQETEMLFEEASMPLEKLLERYSSGGQHKALKALRKKEEFQSPLIKAKKDVNDNSGQAVDSMSEEKETDTLQMEEIKIKLDSQLTNGNNSEAVARQSETKTESQQVKSDTDNSEATGGIDSTSREATEKCTVEQSDITKDKSVSENEPNSSTVNGAIKAESPSEVSSSTEVRPSTGNSSSASVSCSGDTVGGPSASSSADTADASGSCPSSSTGSSCAGGSGSAGGSGGSGSAGGSGDSAGGSSAGGSSGGSSAGGSSGGSSAGGSAGGSSAGGSGDASLQDPVAGSSSGRTRKPRKNVIPDEDEDETSCSEDDEDDEDEWETSEEEEDIDSLVQPDSEDDDVIEGAPCVHSHARDEEDEDTFMTAGEEPGMDSGCTAVVALLRDSELYVANAGDSRCVLCRAGKAVDMSVDHKPEDEIEHNRIRKAGGKITMDGRVNGGLNLSRAIGDHSYKQKKSLSDKEQMITALPDIRTMTLGESDEFMVLACDGIWNVMSSQDVVTFVKERLNSGVDRLSQICEELFEFCLSPDTMGDGTGCDNMTCVIVTFKGDKSQESRDRGEKRPADVNSDSDVKEPQTKRQKADDG